MTTGRALALASALALGALCARGLTSCTTTATDTTPAGICEPSVSVTIANPLAGACIAVPDPTEAVIPVTVDVSNFSLRPPGAGCINTCNCGFVRLYVNGQPLGMSGTAIVSADLRNLPTVYGTFTLTTELVWDLNDGGGADLFDAGVNMTGDGGPGQATGLTTDTVTVTVAPSCGDGGVDAGDGGMTDAGMTDAGDGGIADAGDAGPTDAGDAGSGDAGDAGPGDAGAADAGDAGDAGDGG